MEYFVIESVIEIIKARPEDVHAVIITNSNVITNAYSIEAYLGNVVFNNEFNENIKIAFKDIKFIGITSNEKH